jgi:hypothetical protein
MRNLLFVLIGLAALQTYAVHLKAEDTSESIYRTVPVTLSMEAGSGEFVARPEGGEVHHAGIGYLEPYGPASYSCGLNYPEAKLYPFPDYFTSSFHKAYETDGFIFCVYTVKEGSIYAYDSIAGRISTSTDGRKDELINVIVGGTGEFKGAVGLWVGCAQGRGKVTEVAPGRKLPQSILKLMSGYVRMPVK